MLIGNNNPLNAYKTMLEAAASKPATIQHEAQRFSISPNARQENVSVRPQDIKSYNDKNAPRDPVAMANAGRAAAELDVISKIPLKERSPDIIRRTAELQTLVRSTGFPTKEMFQAYKRIAERDISSGKLNISVSNERQIAYNRRKPTSY